mmetsp:Transcript_4225/g.6862  ORF Transcript_4225/g.6862 Transcript_4225/m.6862 type:complete len:454 (-) Transcript_4225:157-1518(-)
MTDNGYEDDGKMEHVKEVFRNFDSAQRKTIPKDRMIKVLGSLDPTFTAEELDVLLRSSPKASNGEVIYEDFVEFVRAGAKAGSKEAVQQTNIDVIVNEKKSTLQVPEKSSLVNEKKSARQEDSGSDLGLDDDEERIAEEEKERRKMSQMSRHQRKSICAGGASEHEIKSYKPPTFPKPDATKSKIADTIKNNSKMQVVGVANLNGEQLEEMVMAFQEMRVVQGQDVIRQGEQGDCLYVIEEGDFDILISRKLDDDTLGEPAKVASFGPGSLFGELAILYSSPRAATVRCASAAGVIWSLDQKPFQMLLRRCGINKLEQYSGWLNEVEILKVLNLHEISMLADTCEEILVEEGEVIMQQGDIGDAFYILEEGECAAFFEVDGEEKIVKTYSNQGEYFGELALINDAPRKASVKATKDGMVLKIDKENFVNLLGPIIDRLREVASEYPQFADFMK